MQFGGVRHPREMGVSDVEAFLYREVLGIDLPWLNNIGRPQQTKRIPAVLTKDEVAGLLAQMDGVTALLARLLYGTGMRLM
jgi:integrase